MASPATSMSASATTARVSRRDLVAGSSLTALGLVAAGVANPSFVRASENAASDNTVGDTSGEPAGDPSADDRLTPVYDTAGADVSDASEAAWAGKVSETWETDIVVVGTGMSGSAAMVSAAEKGARVVALEANEADLMNNGSFTDCVFEIGTDAQKAAAERYGLEISRGTIISAEENFFNYRVNGLLWKDIMEHSAGNYEWMASHGVQFADEVDYYADAGKYPTAHYFKGGVGTSGEFYITPMHAAAAELGVDIRFGMRARALGTDESGKVVAVYAENVSNGSVVKIDCAAVILAGGGYGCNVDMMAARGLTTDNCVFWSMPGNNGDTLKMAVAAGGKDESLFHGYMDMQVVPGTSGISLASSKCLWVNEDGDRFINEDCTTKTYDVVCPAMRTQQAVFMVVTEEVAAAMFAGVESQWISDFAADIVAAADDPSSTIYKGETVEEAAEAAGLDPAVLAASVARYNELCDLGVDEDYGKESDRLLKLDNGPWYVCKAYQQVYITVGGIATNRRFEVLGADKHAIPGLYAIGMDGIETYLELYNTAVSGGANAYNVNSGRYAAINAVEKYLG